MDKPRPYRRRSNSVTDCANPRSAMNRQKPTDASGLEIGPPELTCYRLWPTSPELTPAKAERDWMDMTSERYAYRCIPLSIANASGWEIALPFPFEAAWYGGDDMQAIQLRSH